MLFFGKERAFDKKLIVSAAVPITPYKKFMKEKPLPKKLLELHWSVFLQQTPDAMRYVICLSSVLFLITWDGREICVLLLLM